jgi:cation transport ATPase
MQYRTNRTKESSAKIWRARIWDMRCWVVSANGFGEQQIIAAASIAEHKSEHPLAKAVVARAMELGIPLVAPDEFSYTPGRGVRVSYEREEILVGSLALLAEHSMTRGCPHLATVRTARRRSTLLARDKFLGASGLRTFCGRKRRMQLRPCGKWV